MFREDLLSLSLTLSLSLSLSSEAQVNDVERGREREICVELKVLEAQ